MRILIALNAYEEDGPGNLVLRLCQRWKPLQDVDVDTVALSRGGPLQQRLRDMGISAHVVPTRGVLGLTRLRDWMKQLIEGPRRPDVVHSHLLWPDLAMRVVQDELKRKGIPLVSTCHGLHAAGEKGLLGRVAYNTAERLTRDRCAAWAAVSEATRDGMLRAGYPKDRVYLIRNGVDCVQTYPLSDNRKAEMRGVLNVPVGAPLIGAVGNLRTLKGHDVLLRAMPAILEQHPRTQLLIVGEGPERGPLLALARSLGVAEHVRLVGHLSVMVSQVIASLDVLVHPSRIEAFGLVVAEAQASAVPVVCSRVGGLPEALRDGETGFLVAPDAPGEIAERVGRLLASGELRELMGRAGREFVNDEREVGNAAEAYLELYRKVAGWGPDRRIFPRSEAAPVEAGRA